MNAAQEMEQARSEMRAAMARQVKAQTQDGWDAEQREVSAAAGRMVAAHHRKCCGN